MKKEDESRITFLQGLIQERREDIDDIYSYKGNHRVIELKKRLRVAIKDHYNSRGTVISRHLRMMIDASQEIKRIKKADRSIKKKERFSEHNDWLYNYTEGFDVGYHGCYLRWADVGNGVCLITKRATMSTDGKYMVAKHWIAKMSECKCVEGNMHFCFSGRLTTEKKQELITKAKITLYGTV